MALATYHRFFSAVTEPGDSWTRVLDPRVPALSFLGVRFVFEDPPPPLPADPGVAGFIQAAARRRRDDFFRSGLLLAYEGPDAVLWERGDALPRAFFPRAWRVESADRALPVAAKIADFASLAVVDRGPGSTPPPTMPEIGVERPNPPAQVLALDVGHRRIDLDVDASADSILATSQPAIPGWRLTIDDVAARERIRTVNTAFLGVAVPPGRHHLALHFAPSSWRLGLVLGSAGALLCALLLLSIAGAARRVEPSSIR